MSKITQTLIAPVLMLVIAVAPVIHAYQLNIDIQENSAPAKCKCCCNCSCSVDQSSASENKCQCRIEKEKAPFNSPLDFQPVQPRSIAFQAEASEIDGFDCIQNSYNIQRPVSFGIYDPGHPIFLINCSIII